MKIGFLFFVFGFLFFLNINFGYSQDSGLELKCELKNVSKDTIGIDYFCVTSNGFNIEKPDGSTDGIGAIACGGKHKNLNVYPDSSMIWKIDLSNRYFETYLWGMRPRKSGIYKFSWVVNGVKSEPFVYEYIGAE